MLTIDDFDKARGNTADVRPESYKDDAKTADCWIGRIGDIGLPYDVETRGFCDLGLAVERSKDVLLIRR